jgi:hypothetical protein
MFAFHQLQHILKDLVMVAFPSTNRRADTPANLLFSQSASQERFDPVLRAQLCAALDHEVAKEALSNATKLQDDDLMERLLAAGFTPATLPALVSAPLALMAWASGAVTTKEKQAVILAISELRLEPPAKCVVQTWLDDLPSLGLWSLWEVYMASMLPTLLPAERRDLAEQLMRHATAIAVASGGVLGFGRICQTEQCILNAMRATVNM